MLASAQITHTCISHFVLYILYTNNTKNNTTKTTILLALTVRAMDLPHSLQWDAPVFLQFKMPLHRLACCVVYSFLLMSANTIFTKMRAPVALLGRGGTLGHVSLAKHSTSPSVTRPLCVPVELTRTQRRLENPEM